MKKKLGQHLENDHTSGNSWWIWDDRGIPIARVCDKCERVFLRRYKPEDNRTRQPDRTGQTDR